MKKLFATLAILIALPVFAQDSKPTPKPTTPAAVTSYQAVVGQKLVYHTLIAPETPNGDLIQAQEHVTVAAINSDGSATLQVKVFKKVSGKLELSQQGTINWKPIPEGVLNKLRAEKKDQITKETVVIGNQSLSCIVVPVSEKGVLQRAWVVVDKDGKNVFPGLVKMTLSAGQDTTTFMELKEITQPTPAPEKKNADK